MKYIFSLLLFLINFQVNAQIITTIAGNGLVSDSGDGGLATMASLNIPYGGFFDLNGNYYFVEVGANRVRCIMHNGIIKTIAGNGIAGFNGDGNLATNAQLNLPNWVCTDAVNNIYISDLGNYRIRKIDTFGIIHTIVGNGSSLFSGDGGSATNATLVAPGGICLDKNGTIYICDETRIRIINTAGIINTIVGDGVVGFSGDGGKADTSKIHAHGIYVDSLNNIFIIDFNRIRKVNAITNIIKTIAGTGNDIYNGDEINADSANLFPIGLAFDNLGDLFTADLSNNRIRMVDSSGIIHTIAGNGIASFGGDGGPATSCEMYDPDGLAFDFCGNLYVTVKQDCRIRKIIYNNFCMNLGADNITDKTDLNISPNPTYNNLNIDNLKTPSTYQLTNLIGRTTQQGTLKKGNNTISLQYLPPGMYLLELIGEDGERVVRKVVKE